VATVSLDAIQANLRAVRHLLARTPPSLRAPDVRTSEERDLRTTDPPGVRPGVIAVVKANAYGHGGGRVAMALEQAGASLVACADVEEGVALREAGVSGRILVFGALSVSDLSGIFSHRLTPTASSPAAARALADAARSRGVRLRCHLKIDTGMNRLGFRHDNLSRTMPAVLGDANLEFEAVYTHFATADQLESPAFETQRARFETSMAALGAMGLRGVKRHAANSAAILRDARTWYDWVRPGLLLYGLVPPPLAAGDLDLRPALSLTSRIVAVKGIRAGEGSGYGLPWSLNEPRSVAIVPAGYADGLDTRLAGRASVLVRGRRLSIVGSVCMDMIMVDVTGLDVAPGDDVVILGRQGEEEITAREVAGAIGTIPWEVICRLGSRIERRYA
jgi:alanine racemase